MTHSIIIMFTKKQAIDSALAEGGHVLVMLDPRRQGVVLPDRLRSEKSVTLVIGLNLPIPIPDLSINEGFLRATLVFGPERFTCLVPMTSVYAVGCGAQTLYWPVDAPGDLADESTQSVPTPAPETPGPSKRAHLKLVD